MNNFELYETLVNNKITKKYLVGVFSADTLPKMITSRPAFLIVNTARYKEKGEHWVCLFFPKQGPSEHFDSLGTIPTQFEHYLLNHSSSYVYNTIQIQSSSSDTCGQFCLYFAFQRSIGNNFFSIILPFKDKSLEASEKYIKDTTCLLYQDSDSISK